MRIDRSGGRQQGFDIPLGQGRWQVASTFWKLDEGGRVRQGGVVALKMSMETTDRAECPGNGARAPGRERLQISPYVLRTHVGWFDPLNLQPLAVSGQIETVTCD